MPVGELEVTLGSLVSVEWLRQPTCLSRGVAVLRIDEGLAAAGRLPAPAAAAIGCA
jgi:hypothetical protein